MSRLGAAVHVVTTAGLAGKTGFTATAVCSVSDQPAMLLVCLNRRSNSGAAAGAERRVLRQHARRRRGEARRSVRRHAAACISRALCARRMDDAQDRRAGARLRRGRVRLPHHRDQGDGIAQCRLRRGRSGPARTGGPALVYHQRAYKPGCRPIALPPPNCANFLSIISRLAEIAPRHEEPAPASAVISLGGGHTLKPLTGMESVPMANEQNNPQNPQQGGQNKPGQQQQGGQNKPGQQQGGQSKPGQGGQQGGAERPRRVQPLTFDVRLRRQPAPRRVAAFCLCTARIVSCGGFFLGAIGLC